MSETPEHWSEVPIGSFARIVGGGTPPSKDPANFAPPGLGIPWLTPADLSGYQRQTVERGARDLTSAGFSACGATLLPKGSVLFSSRAPIGYVAIAANEISTNQGFKSFVLPEGFDPRFCYYQLKHLKPAAEAIATGTTFKELSGAAAATLPFNVAPLNEQIRIADQLDTLLARIKACNDHLDAIPGLLKRFRRAVLRQAAAGDLSREWREAQLPRKAEWQTLRIRDVGTVQLGRQRSPKFHSGSHMRPYLRVQNVFEARLDLSDVMEMNFPPADFERYQLHPGDILLNEGQSPEYLGRPALYKGELPGACFTNTLIRFQSGPFLLPAFALIVFRSQMHAGRYVREGKITTNLAHLGAGRFADVEFSLPSLVLLCHKRSFALALPQQGHCPSRAISS